MKGKKQKQPVRRCGECYHEVACFYAMGGCGSLTNTDAASCANFETITDILERYAEIFGWQKKEATVC